MFVFFFCRHNFAEGISKLIPPVSQFQMSVQAADMAAQEEDEISDRIRQDDDTPAATESGCAENQCPWCGFSDHRRKSKHYCPQHDLYCGTQHQKGDKVSDDWVPGNRKSHETRRRAPLTPHSVRSKPSDPEFKADFWQGGPDALNGHVPAPCTAPRMTLPQCEEQGWTIDTPPIDLFNHFYTVCVQIIHNRYTISHISCVFACSLSFATSKFSGRMNIVSTSVLVGLVAKTGRVYLPVPRLTILLRLN